MISARYAAGIILPGSYHEFQLIASPMLICMLAPHCCMVMQGAMHRLLCRFSIEGRLHGLIAGLHRGFIQTHVIIDIMAWHGMPQPDMSNALITRQLDIVVDVQLAQLHSYNQKFT